MIEECTRALGCRGDLAASETSLPKMVRNPPGYIHSASTSIHTTRHLHHGLVPLATRYLYGLNPNRVIACAGKCVPGQTLLCALGTPCPKQTERRQR
jgi:hypothetical protein